MFRTILTAGLLFCMEFVSSQTVAGCTDPQASNFNAGATLNDGSCVYPSTFYAPAYKAHINSDLREISGLQWAEGEWWSHNDSGFDPDFFSLDPASGEILKKISLKNANNRDWEDVCADGASLYFGDFGNNTNSRKNLGIYRVPYNAIGNSSDQSINDDEYSFIPFAYPDQTDFNTIPEDSAVFDCEAMLYFGGKLHLFTKNRKEYLCSHYTVDPTDGTVQKVETFNSNGLITGADISPDGRSIILVGYDLRGLPSVFCWLLWDWQQDRFFSGNKRRIEFGSALTVGQVESIAFADNYSGYMANEKTEYNGIVLVGTTLWAVDFSAWLPQVSSENTPSVAFCDIVLNPNPTGGYLNITTPEGVTCNIDRWRLFDAEGLPVLEGDRAPEQLDLSGMTPGIYFMELEAAGRPVLRKKVLKTP